jgi:HD-GYP domain-containing protein (c-di-GMP phosphodiesterase class II)
MTPRPAEQSAVRRPNWQVLNYLVPIWALAVATVALGWHLAGPPDDLLALPVFCGLGVMSWLVRENNVGSRVSFSFSSIIILASCVMVGPVGAWLVGIATAVPVFFNRRVPARVTAFNVAMLASVGAIGGLVYLWVNGEPDLHHLEGAGEIIVRVGLPLMVADVCQCIANAVLLAFVMRVANGVPMRTQVWRLLSVTGVAYVGYGVIGFLFVVLWIPARVGAFSALLVLAPLFVARWAFTQYGDELRSHERTLRALVTAVETKEPHNAGHSERVAQLCEWMAEALLLGHKEIDDIRAAGMLHDVGKVAMPTRLLGSRQAHTDDDHVTMAGHALAGVELVKDVDFLSGSVDGIAHHHERYDGRGYPDGLAGETIPLAARIIAVADAFECLTSARSYRPALPVDEALAVVRGQSGSQLDPQIVDVLLRALLRHEWSVTERTPDELASAGVALDHDEPEVSDHIAFTERLHTRITGRAATLHPAGEEVR